MDIQKTFLPSRRMETRSSQEDSIRRWKYGIPSEECANRPLLRIRAGFVSIFSSFYFANVGFAKLFLFWSFLCNLRSTKSLLNSIYQYTNVGPVFLDLFVPKISKLCHTNVSDGGNIRRRVEKWVVSVTNTYYYSCSQVWQYLHSHRWR